MRHPQAIVAALVFACPLLCGCEMFGVEPRPGSASLLDALRGPSPAEAARMALDRYDADRRYRGTMILANAPFAGEPLYMELFQDHADDEDPAVRSAAVRALANHGEPAQAALLVERLKDEEPLVRREAARGLQRLHSPESVPAIIKQLDENAESDSLIRAELAEALGQYPEPRVVQALIAALNDPALAVNRNALRSLRNLTGQDFGLSQREWFEWFQDSQQPFAAQRVYEFPAYRRGRKWYEYIPFVPRPPNEEARPPTGLPGIASASR